MNKNYYSLGLMSGTSMDGVDASIIVSDGEKKLEIIENYYEKYDYDFKCKLREFIKNTDSLEYLEKNKTTYKQLEEQLTRTHFETSKKIIRKAKNIQIDFVGFHGQTILHQPKKGFSIQMGNPNLLSNLLKKKIYFNFRKKDILNGGEGAPLTPIYHYLICKTYEIKLPVIFLNLGGVANITYIKSDKEISSFDVGPGNCLIDQWVRENTNKDYDELGMIAAKGKIEADIIKKAVENKYYLKFKQRSFDIKDFDISFVRGLNLENGAATITEYTSRIIADKIKKFNDKDILILLCGGGRKNKFLLKNISKIVKNNLTNIDQIGIDGDYIESQAFAYLAIRSYLKKNISFPSTTGTRMAVSGGEEFNNY